MSQDNKLKSPSAPGREKERIITDAARKRFAHYGYSKVTMDEIASDVAMGKASLYYYFPAKEDLFREVIIQEQSEFVQNIKSVLRKNVTASKKIKMYVDQRIKHFQDLLNLGTLSIHSFNKSNPMFKKLFVELEKQELSLLKTIIREGILSGEFKSKLPENITTIFLHILQGLRFRALRLIAEQFDEEKAYIELKEEMTITADIFINSIKGN